MESPPYRGSIARQQPFGGLASVHCCAPRGLIARSFEMRCTVPVPIPSDLATFKIQPPSHDRVDQKTCRDRVVNYQLSMMWHSCIVSSRGSGGRHGAGAAMSTEQVEYT